MAILEALVWSPAGLAAPGGVTFPRVSASYEEDMAAWNDLLPAMTTEMFSGRYIMAIVQSRGNTRPWSDAANNFQFSPEEDCMLAAYCLSARLGTPYEPGLCSRDYIKKVMAAGQGGGSVENFTPSPGISKDMFQIFQCSAKGTNLAFYGCMLLLKGFRRSGMPEMEAIVRSADDMTRKDQWGWKGSVFPPLVNRAPGARPRGAGWTSPRA